MDSGDKGAEMMQASRSVGSWRAKPMSCAEIDAHPDCDRIWATLAVFAGAQGEFIPGKAVLDLQDEVASFEEGCK